MTTASLRSEISKLQDLIVRQTVDLDAAKKRLRLLEQELEETAIFPVQALPPEVLAEIFVSCLPKYITVANIHRDIPVPLLLSSICRRWRELALNFPRLWTDIALCIIDQCGEPDWRTRAGVAAKRLDLCAARAGVLPLRIAVGCSAPQLWSNKPPHIDFPPLIAALRRHASRVCSFSVDLDIREALLLDKAANEIYFSKLQEISTHLAGHSRTISPPYSLFTLAPNLRAVTFDGTKALGFKLYWDRLTEFTGLEYTLEECVDALALTPNLRKAHFELVPVLRPGPFNRVVHSRLEELEVHEWREDQAHVLEFFEFPALHHLSVVTTEDSDSALIAPEKLSHFLRHSGANLQTLVLDGPWHGHDMIPIAQLSITRLEVRQVRYDFVAELFDSLKMDDAGFLPKLTRLEVHWLLAGRLLRKAVTRAGDAILRRNWRSRRIPELGHCAIKVLTLVSESRDNFLDSLDSEDLRDFRSLRRDGVHVHVGSRKFNGLDSD